MENLKKQILAFIHQRRGRVSFVELRRHLGGERFDGDRLLLSADGANILLWTGMSDDIADALLALLAEERIELRTTPILTYAADGGGLNLPIAARRFHYKYEHWLPVLIDLGDRAFEPL